MSEETRKKIGTLTIEERREKIQKYLEKRKNRNWKKRINYDCRKRVADNRIRLKGRFVTKEQAKMLQKHSKFILYRKHKRALQKTEIDT